MLGQVDYRDKDFQVILDIKPTKVSLKENKDKLVNKDVNEEGEIKDDLPHDIFDYFKLPAPSECHPGILGDIKEISERVKVESDDDNEFFRMLQAIEKQLPAVDDSIKRLRQVVYFLRTIQGSLKEALKDQLYDMDVLTEEAKDTGNWRQYLRVAEKKDNEIRNHS